MNTALPAVPANAAQFFSEAKHVLRFIAMSLQKLSRKREDAKIREVSFCESQRLSGGYAKAAAPSNGGTKAVQALP